MHKPWYRGGVKRLLVDMHIPDWDEKFLRDFSAERYADCMVAAGVDTVEIYAGSCLGLCNWPTRKGYRHRNAAPRDLLGATVAACRERGLSVVIYLNVWSRRAYDEHPEWRMIHADGKGSVEHDPGRFGVCCPNTGFQPYFLELLDELNRSYECSGLWIDMIGWFNRICYCPGCRTRFQRETGRAELPRRIDWDDPAWNEFQSCRERWLAEFAARIRDTVKAHTPERSVALQCSSILGGWGGAVTPEFLRQSDYLAADLYSDQYEQSFVCKLFRAFSAHQPIEFMVPRCENLAHHTTTRSRINLTMRSYASLANQAAFTLIDAIDPTGTLDASFYRTAGELNRGLDDFRPGLNPDSEPIADVGIYYDFASAMDVHHPPLDTAEFQSDLSGYRRWINLVRALQARHLTVAFTGTTDPAPLSRFRVVIVSEATHLDDAACAALTAYAHNGGRLYVSGSTSLYDRHSGRRHDFRLAPLLGVRFTGRMFPAGCYLAPRPDCNQSRPAPLISELPQPEIEPIIPIEKLRLRGTVMLPYSGPEELTRFGSAISNPPERDTGCPGLIERQFGAGRVLYSTAVIESEPYDFHRECFADWIEELVGDDRTIVTDAPAAVEFTVFEQESGRRRVVSLLHFTTELPPPPLGPIAVALQLPERRTAIRIIRLPDGAELPFRQNGRQLAFTVSDLDKFTMLSIEMEKQP